MSRGWAGGGVTWRHRRRKLSLLSTHAPSSPGCPGSLRCWGCVPCARRGCGTQTCRSWGRQRPDGSLESVRAPIPGCRLPAAVPACARATQAVWLYVPWAPGGTASVPPALLRWPRDSHTTLGGKLPSGYAPGELDLVALGHLCRHQRQGQVHNLRDPGLGVFFQVLVKHCSHNRQRESPQTCQRRATQAWPRRDLPNAPSFSVTMSTRSLLDTTSALGLAAVLACLVQAVCGE